MDGRNFSLAVEILEKTKDTCWDKMHCLLFKMNTMTRSAGHAASALYYITHNGCMNLYHVSFACRTFASIVYNIQS